MSDHPVEETSTEKGLDLSLNREKIKLLCKSQRSIFKSYHTVTSKAKNSSSTAQVNMVHESDLPPNKILRVQVRINVIKLNELMPRHFMNRWLYYLLPLSV